MNTLKMRTVFMVLALLSSAAAIADEGILKFIVYGATGNVGSRVVSEALNRGHQVTAVSRNPSKVKKQHENLLIVQGDILDSQSVAELITDHDVVVVSVKGSADGSKDPEQAVHRLAADVLITTLRNLGDGAPRFNASLSMVRLAMWAVASSAKH